MYVMSDALMKYDIQVLLSVISTSLSDSKVSNGDTSKTALTKDAAKDGEVVKDAEVWSVVSEALDSFLFPEAKPPQVEYFLT